MIEVIARHMVGGVRHDHIAEVTYVDSTGKTGTASRKAMVEWLDKSTNNKAIVRSRQNRNLYAYVGTIHPDHSPAYIRTHADGKWTDNLLALPEY